MQQFKKFEPKSGYEPKSTYQSESAKKPEVGSTLDNLNYLISGDNLAEKNIQNGGQ